MNAPAACPAHSAQQVAAICRTPEAAQALDRLSAAVPDPARAQLLWLTWVQWRALGREAMIGETGLSLWTITCRLRQIRESGVPVLSWAQETDLLARGRFSS